MGISIATFDTPRWFACHTKPRCEKKFASLMQVEGVEHYLPLVESVRIYEGKKRRHLKPLFSSYVFTCIPPTHRDRIYQQNLLVRALWIDDQVLFLKQLGFVRTVVESGIQTTLQPLVKKGVRVRISSGPFYGVEGYVESPDSPRGVVVALDILQQGVLVPIPLEQLEVLP